MDGFTRVLLGSSLACLLVLGGCAGGGSDPATGDDDDDDGATWTPLATAEWTLPGFSEDTSDLHVFPITREIYIGGIRPIAPPGTHHTVLYKGASGGDTSMIYASGVGTGELVFPAGVGLKLAPGDQIGLELHIFNVEAAELSGTSGIEVLEVDAADVEHEADIFLPGPFSISLDPMQVTTMSDSCTVLAPQTVFALFPHMHQLGTHFKTTLVTGGGSTVIHDAPYYFDDQAFTGFPPVALSPGDSIETECTWNNTTTDPVGWGESSNAEMCFSILYRYPAQPGSDFCSL